jgi:hypothetical protein
LFLKQLKNKAKRQAPKHFKHNNMKKSIFLACGLSLLSVSLFAQQFSVGLRAGYTRSDLTIIEPDGLDPNYQLDGKFKPLNSFHAGADLRMSLSERFGILASLLYTRKGYVGELAWPTGIAEATYELHYLNLPVVADFRVWKGLSLQGGAEFGRLLSARVKSAGENAEISDFYEEFDLGLVAGLEHRFAKGFFVGARHVFGIYNIQDAEITDETGAILDDLKSLNSATQLSVGYRHTIGR